MVHPCDLKLVYVSLSWLSSIAKLLILRAALVWPLFLIADRCSGRMSLMLQCRF